MDRGGRDLRGARARADRRGAAHRRALRNAATSGSPKFFLGTDSAPHAREAKESACGCAGLFTAPNALECLAQVFEDEGALDRLEGFASLHGPAFYGLAPNPDRIVLVRDPEPQAAPAKVPTPDGTLTVFDPGIPVHWRIEAAPGPQMTP